MTLKYLNHTQECCMLLISFDLVFMSAMEHFPPWILLKTLLFSGVNVNENVLFEFYQHIIEYAASCYLLTQRLG